MSNISNEGLREGCFLSLPHGFNTVREGLKDIVNGIGGDSYFVIVSQGDTLRNEIKNGIGNSTTLIADLSSPSNDTCGPRPTILWELGFAEANNIANIVICQEKDKDNIPSILKESHAILYDINNISPMLEEVEGALLSIIARKKTAGQSVYTSKCYVDRTSSDLELRYLKADTHIKILELNLESITDQLDMIIRALKKKPDLSVQILTLNPFSKFSEDRANQLAVLPLHYRRQLYNKIKETYDRLEDINIEKWGLRIYDTFPTQIMFQVDHALIHSVISLGKKSRDMLHFEVQNSQPNAYDTFEAHFAQLWGLSMDYEEWYKQNKAAVTNLLTVK